MTRLLQVIKEILTDATLLAGLVLIIRKEVREAAEHRWKREDRERKDEIEPPEL